jgi:hypothetical protein
LKKKLSEVTQLENKALALIVAASFLHIGLYFFKAQYAKRYSEEQEIAAKKTSTL